MMNNDREWLDRAQLVFSRFLFGFATEEEIVDWATDELASQLFADDLTAIAMAHSDDIPRPSEQLASMLERDDRYLSDDQRALSVASWISARIIAGTIEPIDGARQISGLIQNRFDEREQLLGMLTLWSDARPTRLAHPR